MKPLLPPVKFRSCGFTLPDLLVTLAVLTLLLTVILPVLAKSRAHSHEAQCLSNLKQVGRAVLLYAENNQGRLPQLQGNLNPGPPQVTWWFYKEKVKALAGLSGPSSSRDRVFACPDDRGYEDGRPFYASPKSDYNSYVFNGVSLPGVPNLPSLAGRSVASIKDPARTLLVMEWTAHAPLSWHKSRTGSRNQPFYNDAESVVAFANGAVKSVRIYYDGFNPAYSRDPIAGYEYKYSGD